MRSRGLYWRGSCVIPGVILSLCREACSHVTIGLLESPLLSSNQTRIYNNKSVFQHLGRLSNSEERWNDAHTHVVAGGIARSVGAKYGENFSRARSDANESARRVPMDRLHVQCAPLRSRPAGLPGSITTPSLLDLLSAYALYYLFSTL
jgi:hypothetical protein